MVPLLILRRDVDQRNELEGNGPIERNGKELHPLNLLVITYMQFDRIKWSGAQSKQGGMARKKGSEPGNQRALQCTKSAPRTAWRVIRLLFA